jgi:excisionase family DNA binding protein
MPPSTATPAPACLTVAQVAEHAGVSESLVRRAIHAGELRASRLGRMAYRVRRIDVDAWLDRNAVQPAVPAPAAARPRVAADVPRRLDW